jgi:hypothetical protein
MIFPKNITLLYVLLFLCAFNCSKDEEQNIPTESPEATSVDFIRTYGGSKNDSAQSIVKTDDGGYAILGFTQSIDGDILNKNNDSYDFWVLKFNAEDELQWNKTYGGTAEDKGSKIIQTQDGGFAIIGTSSSTDGDVSINAGLKDFWMAKLDASGNLIWQKSFGFSGIDSGYTLLQTDDNGYFITGVLDVTASGGQGNSKTNQSQHAGGDYWALKLTASGDLEWSKYFGGNYTDTPYDAIQTQDNNYIIVGSSDSDDTDISSNIGTYDFWVTKISTSGTLIWEKSFGGTQIDEARAIVESNDGNFIIAGDTRSNDINVSENKGAADLWLIKINFEGNLLWEKTIGGTNFDVARSIHKTANNNLVIAGSSRSSDGQVTNNQGQNDAWTLKINAIGNLIWQHTVGGTNIDYAYSVTQLNNNSIITVGDSSSDDGDISENKGFSDLLIIKMK